MESSNLTFNIEQPTTRKVQQTRQRISGWCYLAGSTLTSVQLVVDGKPYSGVYGKPRPDVRQVFLDAPLECGFQIDVRLSPGTRQVALRFLDRGGGEMTAHTWSIEVARPLRPLWLQGDSSTLWAQTNLGAYPQHPPRRLHEVSRSREPDPRTTFTIVTPSYQQGEFLSETIASVLVQGARGLNYFISDGGSNDNTLDILRSSPSGRFRWRSQPDEGQAAAIAHGFAQLPEDDRSIMAWINSDDFYLRGAFHAVSKYFLKHPAVDVVYGHRLLVDENSNEIGRWFLPPHADEVLDLYDFVPQETMFWRRRIWEKVGGIDLSLKFAMDWDLLLRFRAAGAKIVRVPYFFACFRIHSAQKTSALMESVGQKEIDALRLRTFGRVLPPNEIETHPRLLRYLRKSSWIEFLWRRFGIRHP